MVDAALTYAARGWHVLPCQPRGKTPLTSRGQDDATIDPRVIRGWWRRWPTANIGVATEPSRLVVLDVDGADGWASFTTYPDAPGGGFTIPPTVTSVTGRGSHLIYHVPAGASARANCVAMDGWAGLDVRGNGFIIIPPSVHPSGAVYRWVDGHDHLAPTRAPGFLLASSTPPPPRDRVMPREWAERDTRYAVAAVRAATRNVAGAREGTRNATLNTAAYSLGQLVAGGELTHHTAVDALTASAAQAGLPAREAARTIQSGLRAGVRRPRQAPRHRHGQELRARDTAPHLVIT